MLHNVIGGSVLLEDIVDTHDMPVAHTSNQACFFQELILEAIHQGLASCGTYRHSEGDRVAVAEVAHEEFLDGHRTSKHHLLCEIGDAKSALAQNALDLVFSTLEDEVVR